MWPPPARHPSKASAHAAGSYVNMPLAPPTSTLSPDEASAASLLHLQKLYLSQVLATTAATGPSAAAMPYAAPLPTAAEAAAMYYSASSMMQSTPLGVMAHLQQYLRGLSTTPHAALADWPAASAPHFHGAPVDRENLLLSRQSTLMPSSSAATVDTANERAMSAINPFANSSTMSSNVLDLLPLDILTDTFVRLNAMRLSSTNAASQAAMQQFMPAASAAAANLSPTAAAAAAVTSHNFGAASREAMAAAMLSLRSCDTTSLFKPYFSLDQAQQMIALNALKSPTLCTSATAAAAAAATSTAVATNLSKGETYNYVSSLRRAAKSSSSAATSSSTSSAASLSSSSSTRPCDLKRALRKRSDDLLQLHTTSGRTRLSVAAAAALQDEADDESLLPPPKKKWIRHYLNANHQLQSHVQSSNGNSNSSCSSSSMMVDDIPPTQQHRPGYATTSGMSTSVGQQHSPPRQTGNQYMSMLSQQAGAAGSTHVSARRRTISSTSNGGGNREVHNKLEKNRRAHLKECYEALKNQLPLKDEDRRKTSNLAILGEAYKVVQNIQKKDQELEEELEKLANEKVNLQKRVITLKRELGPKYDKLFSKLFPEEERETIIDTHSLSSGRGSTLYRSSSSLSSVGSNGSNSNGSSNAMSSPVGAGLQTAMPTAISPVINKINNNNNNNNTNSNNISNISSTSPILISNNNTASNATSISSGNIVTVQRKQPTTAITTALQTVTIPTQVLGGGSAGAPTAATAAGVVTAPSSVASLLVSSSGNPNSLAHFTAVSGTMPLSLTAKNISATAITRGSPTPSTPSPSPSSSSGVSSSSSLISSSPPINGVINNGRSVNVNIPNGLKLQPGSAVNGIATISGGTLTSAHTLPGTPVVVSNGTASATAAATIIAAPASAQGVANCTNNAAVAATAANHYHMTHTLSGGRKKCLSIENLLASNTPTAPSSGIKHHGLQHQHHHHHPSAAIAAEDGEQPAKFLKVFNAGSLMHNGGGGNGGLLVGGIPQDAVPASGKVAGDSVTQHSKTKVLSNGYGTAASDLCRLPGGAELNILPTINSSSGGSSSNNNSSSYMAVTTSSSNGLKSSDGPPATLATAFYHANGKITFVSGQTPSPIGSVVTATSGARVIPSNGLLLKDVTSNVAPLLVTKSPTATAISTPPSSLHINNMNDLHFAGNFAQLLAAATASSNTSASKLVTSCSATAGGVAAAAATTNNGIALMNGGIGVGVGGVANVPHATIATAKDMAKTPIKSKSSIAAWRSGAATTIN